MPAFQMLFEELVAFKKRRSNTPESKIVSKNPAFFSFEGESITCRGSASNTCVSFTSFKFLEKLRYFFNPATFCNRENAVLRTDFVSTLLCRPFFLFEKVGQQNCPSAQTKLAKMFFLSQFQQRLVPLQRKNLVEFEHRNKVLLSGFVSLKHKRFAL